MKLSVKILTSIVPLLFANCTKKESVLGWVKNPDFEKKINSYVSGSVPIITIEDLRKNQNEVIIFDARALEEYSTSHINGAILFNIREIRQKKELWQNKKIVVYCSIGYRSEKKGEELQKLGFENVYNLYGGIFEWVNEGLPLENMANQETLDIHTYNKSWSQWITNKNYHKNW